MESRKVGKLITGISKKKKRNSTLHRMYVLHALQVRLFQTDWLSFFHVM